MRRDEARRIGRRCSSAAGLLSLKRWAFTPTSRDRASAYARATVPPLPPMPSPPGSSFPFLYTRVERQKKLQRQQAAFDRMARGRGKWIGFGRDVAPRGVINYTGEREVACREPAVYREVKSLMKEEMTARARARV